MIDANAHNRVGTAIIIGTIVSQSGIQSDATQTHAKPIHGSVRNTAQNPCESRNPLRHAVHAKRRMMAHGMIANAPSKSANKNAELAGANPGSVSANPIKNHTVTAIEASKPNVASPAIKRSTGRPFAGGRWEYVSARVTRVR
jgi:hypothetical protein